MKSNITDLPYFSSRVTFGLNGVQSVSELGDMTEYEAERLAEASEQLKKEIEKGLEFAATL